MIETNRLKLYAASKEQMEAFIAAQSIDVLTAAYTEMLDGCLAHPDQWEWYAIWMIELKDGTHIGELCFKGITEEGNAEIGYGIAEKYQNCGYATEAVSALVDWAFKQPEISCVTAETEESNIASQRVLRKSGFLPTGKNGEEGPLFVRKKDGNDKTSILYNEFKAICLHINNIGITPTLMGSLGLEFVSEADWDPSDIDIHVPGDPRGWKAPDELRIFDWDKIMSVMGKLGYHLMDVHEHEFQKDGISVEYGSIDSLYDFAGIPESEIGLVQMDGITFRVPNLQQFLTIYEASSKDSYRNDHNNNKDFKKIDWLKKHI